MKKIAAIMVISWTTALLLFIIGCILLSNGPIENYAFDKQFTTNEILWIIGMIIIFLSAVSCLVGISAWTIDDNDLDKKNI